MTLHVTSNFWEALFTIVDVHLVGWKWEIPTFCVFFVVYQVVSSLTSKGCLSSQVVI